MQKTQMYRLYLPCITQKLDEIIHICFVGAVWHVANRPEMNRLYLPCSTQKLDEIIHLYFVGAVWHVAIRPEVNLGWPH